MGIKINRLLKYIIAVLVFMVFSTRFAYSQNSSSYKYLVTKVDGKKFKELFDFIASQNEVDALKENTIALYERKLVEDSTEFGIYQFGVMGSDQIPFLLFLDNMGTNFIIKYDTESILEQLKLFFNRNENVFNEETKIEYLKKVADFLYLRDLGDKGRSFKVITKKK